MTFIYYGVYFFFFTTWRNLQFKIDSEREIEVTFHKNFIYF